MHNAWKSSVSKMHVSANGSSASMYISVNLLVFFFFPSMLAMRPSRKKRRKMTQREEWRERRGRRDLGCLIVAQDHRRG